MKILSLLLALILCGAAFALNSTSPAILEYGTLAVPSDQTLSVHPFTFRNATAYAVVSNNSVYGIFASGLPFIEDSPLTSEADLRDAIIAYYVSQSYSSNLSFEDVHAGIVSVSDNYQKGEDKCRILTGTDRTACTDFESCQKACYSVTSFCLNIALGSGRDFVNEIWEFENNSDLLDLAYANESKAYVPLLDGITLEEAKAYLNAVSELNRAATRSSKSALYDGYSYCFEPDYALPVITNMQLSAQKSYQKSEPFFTLDSLVSLVKNRTQDVLSSKAAQLAALEEKKLADKKAAEEKAALAAQQAAEAQSAQPEPPPAPQQDILPIAGAGVLGIIIIAGIYLAFFAKKKPHKGT